MESGRRKRSDEGTATQDPGARESVVQRCIEALGSAGAPVEFCAFYADVISCEYDMTHTMCRLQKRLRDIGASDDPLNCEFLFASIQAMTKKLFGWKNSVDGLAERAFNVPPLMLNPNKMTPKQTTVKALCSFETIEMNLREGEDLVITDATLPDRLRVRNSRGDEGYVPALCCFLPSPDNNATNAVERLQVHLLTSWTDCVQKVKRLLVDQSDSICRLLTNNWTKWSCCLMEESEGRDRERISRRFLRLHDSTILQEDNDLRRLHRTLIGLEQDLRSLDNFELNDMIGTVSNLDKAVLCYQSMYKEWRNFRHSLKQAPRPIRLVPHFNQMRQLASGKNFTYYEVKMTLDDIEILEEITYRSGQTAKGPRVQVGPLPGGSSAKHETMSAEELTSSTQEEKKQFVIRSVVDLRDDAEISLQEAISAGIIDPRRGVYVDLSTGGGGGGGRAMAIPLAMNEGLIKVEYVSTKRTPERREAFGLITIRTQIDYRECVAVSGALDAVTAERLDADEARRRGILNEDEDWYLVGTTGQRIPLIRAIDEGWVFAAFSDDDAPDGVEPQFEVRTYAVSQVRDHARRMDVSFADAVRRGLIDSETGDYVNSLTGERMHVVDAIQGGALRVRPVEGDAAALNVSPSNSVVVDRIQKVNRRIVKDVQVVSAFQKAGGQEGKVRSPEPQRTPDKSSR